MPLIMEKCDICCQFFSWPKKQLLLCQSPVSRDRLVVRTLRCGRSNPGSNPGHGMQKQFFPHPVSNVFGAKRRGLNRDLNPGPLAPKARIIPLDHWAMLHSRLVSDIDSIFYVSNSCCGYSIRGLLKTPLSVFFSLKRMIIFAVFRHNLSSDWLRNMILVSNNMFPGMGNRMGTISKPPDDRVSDYV